MSNSQAANIHRATAIIATRPAQDTDTYWYAVTMAIHAALGVRTVLLTTRTEDGQHQPRQMLSQHSFIAPDGSVAPGALLEQRPLPPTIPISPTNSNHRSMHSVAAHHTEPAALVVRGNTDPLIEKLDRDVRYQDEWAGKTSYFIPWYDHPDDWRDHHTVPRMMISFAEIRRRRADEIEEIFETSTTALYDLIAYKLREIYPPPLRSLTPRELRLLEAEANYGYDDDAIMQHTSIRSIRTHRRRLSKLDIPNPRAYAIHHTVISP